MVQLIDFGMVGERMLIEGFRAWVAAAAPDLRVVAEAPTVEQFVLGVGGERPNVVVLDVALGDRSDPAVNIGALVSRRHRVVVVSARPWSRRIAETIAAGARGYVTRDQDLRTLADAVRVVASGGLACPVEPLAAEAEAVDRDDPGRRPHLSAREWAVLHAYTSGLTLDTAARRVGISPATAKTYLARVKAKYAEVGRPAHTKLELAVRVREDCPAPDDCPGHKPGPRLLPDRPGERSRCPVLSAG
jgi:DNA-binding NarL/FixJ family response regulator